MRALLPQDTIEQSQYQLGWELISTGHTVQQVLSATKLTRPQLAWLMQVGSDRMPSYHKRLAEQVARIRARSQQAADIVGTNAIDALKRASEITGLAQTVVRNLLAVYVKTQMEPVRQKVQDGTNTEDDISALSMRHSMRETLRVLKPYCDFSETAKAFRIVFDSPHQTRDPLTDLPREARLDLSGEAQLPAAMALIEELTGQKQLGHDLLDDLLPEYKGWTEDEITTFIETGKRPTRDFLRTDIPALNYIETQAKEK
jgi:hypothetical protein